MNNKVYWLIAAIIILGATANIYLGQLYADESKLQKNTVLTDEYFALSPTRTHSGNIIPTDKLGSSEYCGHCHTEVFQQWNASAHHFSSFNNPVYRKIALKTAEKKGIDALKFCAGCHDPLPLLSGEMDNLDLTSWSTNAGITCIACHRITEVHGGNGNYVVDEPTLHPFALAESPKLQKAHQKLLEITPWLHTKVLNKPFYSSSEYCATCHTLITPKEINGSTDIVLQDEYSDWRASHYANNSTNNSHKSEIKHLSYPENKTCSDCHMPLVESTDPAAKDGLIKSHNFAGGNTLLPTFHRDKQHLEATEKFLKDDAIKLSITGIRHNAKDDFIAIKSSNISPGDQIELALQVKNTGVGHNFPAGTVDSNEAWLEITVNDAEKNTLFNNGALDSNGEISSDSITFGATLVDQYGNKTDRRNSTSEAVSVKEQRLIKPGSSKQVYYTFTVPDTATLPITINAQLNWRKYSPSFARWVFEGREIPELPITVMAQTQVIL